MIHDIGERFITLVEVMPASGARPEKIIRSISRLESLPIDALTVPTNPVAKPYLDALSLCVLIHRVTSTPVVLHCTTRDHNRIALQGLLWGAKSLGIETVIAASGDRVGVPDSGTITSVHDYDVFSLIELIRKEDIQPGAVLDPRWAENGLETEITRLKKKAEAGAQFAVTQPVYDRITAETLARAVEPIPIAVFMGVLPLWSQKHTEFLHRYVAGIHIPDRIRRRMEHTDNPRLEGIAISRAMTEIARELFPGMCLMPPFGHYEILEDILDIE